MDKLFMIVLAVLAYVNAEETGLRLLQEPVVTKPPLTTTYVPKGTESIIDDLPIYTVGSGKNAMIKVYDILGFNGGENKTNV